MARIGVVIPDWAQTRSEESNLPQAGSSAAAGGAADRQNMRSSTASGSANLQYRARVAVIITSCEAYQTRPSSQAAGSNDTRKSFAIQHVGASADKRGAVAAPGARPLVGQAVPPPCQRHVPRHRALRPSITEPPGNPTSHEKHKPRQEEDEQCEPQP